LITVPPPPADGDSIDDRFAAQPPGARPGRSSLTTSLGKIQTALLGKITPVATELVASRLVQSGVGVVEVRLRDAIAVREGGPYALSDDARDVARRVQARAALSGSYAVTSEYALVTARLIDVATGIVLSSWDKRIPIGYPDYALFDMTPGWTGADRGFYAFR
jgi:hypothetical protein